ncbi:hypothetical protein JAAARDRAFT_198744 [Jaapia argillacea MUCL 33604]|uniref:Uncharacterized protein n=1 Tax=Jaapia argillacea MUCL 33604 TaxID=933084 RepID=A0A067PLH4_9AGAM|nr:hypothetical protein JAAARDRAFT_198744 [Jaapia argillacea MUCL 33604]
MLVHPKPKWGASKAANLQAQPPAVALPPPKRPSCTKKSVVKSKEFIDNTPPENGGKRVHLTVLIPTKSKPTASSSRIRMIDFEPENPKVKIQALLTVLNVPMSYPVVPQFQDHVIKVVGILPVNELDAMIQCAINIAMEKIVEEELKPLCNDVANLKAKSRKLEKLCKELWTKVDLGRRHQDLHSVAMTSDNIVKLEKAHDADMCDLKKQVGLFVSLPKS